MVTKNRRIAAYLPKLLEEKFELFKTENKMSGDSSALIFILSEYLGVSHDVSQEVTYHPKAGVLERVKVLEEGLRVLTEKVNAIKQDVDGSDLLSVLEGGLPPDDNPGQMSLLDGKSSAEIPSELLGGLSARALEKRWPVSRKAIASHKETSRDDFLSWSAEQDPEGIGWEYRDGRFYPVRSDL